MKPETRAFFKKIQAMDNVWLGLRNGIIAVLVIFSIIQGLAGLILAFVIPLSETNGFLLLLAVQGMAIVLAFSFHIIGRKKTAVRSSTAPN